MAHAHKDQHDHSDHSDHHHASHEHSHSHGHGHAHHHDLSDTGMRSFGVAVLLNLGFVAIEAVYSWVAHSAALLADAGHNLSDVLGLLLAWGAVMLARSRPNGRYTYGLRASSILAALANAALLLLACGAIGWESVQRLLQPPPVAGLTVSVVAGVGIAINGFSAWLFMRGSKTDLNVRGAYLHMAADAAISLGVALGGLLMLWTGWYWLDGLLSLLIVAVIVAGSWGLLRDSLRLALGAVPAHVDAVAVEAWLRQQPGVQDLHDLHIWGLSTSETALTGHLLMPEGHPGDAALQAIAKELRERFAVHHATLQVDLGGAGQQCVLLTQTA